MAPKPIKRLHPSEVAGLQRLLRRELLQLLHAIEDAPAGAANISKRSWESSYHQHFDAVRCEERFQYAEKPGGFVWEYAAFFFARAIRCFASASIGVEVGRCFAEIPMLCR